MAFIQPDASQPGQHIFFARCELLNRIKSDLPDGLFCKSAVQPLWQKYFAWSFGRNRNRANHLVPHRGAYRDRHGRGAGCGGRGRRQRRGRAPRTEKSCGPDAPALASSWRRQLRRRRCQQADHRGEHEGNRKTIARGMPGDFRCDRGD